MPINYYPVGDNAARQLIDAMTVFDEYRRVQQLARRFAGGMYWKRQAGGEYEYLVKTLPDNRQQRIGPRSPETEQTFASFVKGKAETEERLRALKAAFTDAERTNKALKVGRVPNIVVDVLQAIENAGLGCVRAPKFDHITEVMRVQN